MKAYICDVCKVAHDKPSGLSMREFRLRYPHNMFSGALVEQEISRRKFHMCSYCFNEFVRTCQKKKASDESQ